MTVEAVLLKGVQLELGAVSHRAPPDASGLCAANGYTDYRAFPSGRDACIARIGLNYAILADLTPSWYGDRWCYHTYTLAWHALDAWTGDEDSEPQGWHRHPSSGRRRPDGDASKEYVNW